MPDGSIPRRIFITAGFLIVALLLLHAVSHGERHILHAPMGNFPRVVGPWIGTDFPLDADTLKVVAVDEYVNRIYRAGNAPYISLYIGYYSSQQTGDAIHSPKNCLPGAGWEPVHTERLSLEVPGRREPVVINEYLVERGLDRQLVLYWYQGRGRVIASEYSGKVWMVTDAIMRNRTDAAMIRVITPIGTGEAAARSRAVGFVDLIFPDLSEFIPN